MAAVYRHANGRCRDAHIVVAHDFLCLVNHLHFLFGIEVFLEDINLRQQVEGNLIMLLEGCTGQNVSRYGLACYDIRNLLFELCHSFLAATGYGLIRGDNYTFDFGNIIKRLQCHNHDNGRAVRIGDNALMLGNGFRIDFRHNQRNFRVHAEGTGVIDNHGTGFYSGRRKFLAGTATSEQGDIHILEGIHRGFLNGIFLAHKLDFLASTALRSQHFEVSKREIALLNEI